MQAEDLLQRLRTFALRSKSQTIELPSFIRSLPADLADAKLIETGVRELSFRGEFSTSTDSGRQTVTFPDFPVIALAEEYRRVESDSSLPFPREETVPVPLLEGELVSVEAKGHLGALLQAAADKSSGAVKLIFPENVPPMVVPRSCVGTDLIEAAVSRISRYLQDPRNVAFMESKLLSVFRGSEAPVRQTLEDIALRPRKATSSVMSPTEFSFRFWSHLSNKIVADVGAKTERTDLDQALLQSAYLVAYASFHQKGAAEREKERAADRKGLELLVRRPPYVFSTQDMLLVKDANGAVLSVKHGREFITSFLEESSTASDEESLPFLVRAHAAAQKRDYYIQRDFIVPVFLKALGDAGDRLRVAFVREWVDAMRKDKPPETCRSDPLFRKEVDQRVRAEFPVIPALAHAPLLRLAAESPFLVEEARNDLERCFSRSDALRPMHVLAGPVAPEAVQRGALVPPVLADGAAHQRHRPLPDAAVPPAGGRRGERGVRSARRGGRGQLPRRGLRRGGGACRLPTGRCVPDPRGRGHAGDGTVPQGAADAHFPVRLPGRLGDQDARRACRSVEPVDRTAAEA